MSLHPKRLAAVFYLPLATVPGDLVELVTEAGGSGLGKGPKPDGTLDCLWASLSSEARLIQSSFFRILIISFWQSQFLSHIGSGSEETTVDGARNVAEAFGRACEVLGPAFAFVATHLDQAAPEWAVGLEWSVLNHEANDLATQGLGLLYFSPEMDDHWVPRASGEQDRESLPVSRGRLMFAGKGPFRWF